MKRSYTNIHTGLIIILSLVLSLTTACSSSTSGGHEYFVDKAGSDLNDGSFRAPFLTINKAAQVAMPGDVVTVHSGIYREWVKPVRGGNSEDKRITYQAAPGEDVRILGSELAKGWTNTSKDLWKIELEDAFFGEINPFKMLIRHPEYVTVDESGDGWGWLKYGRWTHRGDVIINGEGLTEKETFEELESNPMTWFTEELEDKTVIWANFDGADPNSESVELNARAHAFFPQQTGLSYITLRGFTFMNVASHWAPPTVFQPGALGPNGGHHWIIEENIIMYAKAAAISIGIPSEEFEAELRGHHIIRNNVIMRCGQGATTGQSWSTKSQIYGNHIEDINYRREFGGWETAAIKHHNADSLVLRSNFIRGVYTIDPGVGAAHGIWNDYQNSNWNISQNIILDTEGHSILLEANWEGPNLLANNILVNGTIGTYSTRGDAWVQNMFVNCEQEWDNQTWGNRPQIGNARWMNNIFIGGGLDADIVEDASIYDRNVFLDHAKVFPGDRHAVSSSVPSEFILEEDENGISLKFKIADKILAASYPVITAAILDLPFSFDSSIETDFTGEARSGENKPGPFSDLRPGENEVEIYKFPPLYRKALSMIQKIP